jgi:alpha-1,3-rhamnosyltransferase
MKMNKQKPLVSVVIPCYNHEKFVQDCIQSVIDQTYQNIELIIIDDGSKDGSVEKIQEMIPACQERFIRFEFRYRPNKGLSETLNEALEWCEGLYLSPIASDDQMLKQKIQLQVNFLEKNSNYSAVFGGINQIDDNNKIVRTLTRKKEKYSFKQIAELDYFLQAPTQFFKLSDIKMIGGYNSKFRIEDWYSYLLLTKDGRDIYIMEEVLCNYRRHDNNSSKKIDIMFEKIEIIKEIGLPERELNNYIPFVYLSIASDFAIFYKVSSFKLFCKAVVKKPTILFRIKGFKVLMKILLPKKILWRNM